MTDYREEASSLIKRLNSLVEEESASAEAESGEVLESLAELGNSVAQTPSSDLNDLQLKAVLYQALAAQGPADMEDLTVEERLVQSIISDLGRLFKEFP